MALTLGIVDLVVNGTKIDTEKGASFMSGGLIQNPLVAGRQLHVAQEWKEGMVECTTVLKAGQAPSSLYQLGALEIQALCDTGQTLSWTGYQVGERPKFTGGEGGKVALKFAVSEGQELLS